MTDGPVRPFLITKDESGAFRLTVRDTRYNSQDYPVVTSHLQDEIFPTAGAAKAFAKEKFNAKTGEYAMK
ncbi:hypothetical protein [Alteraurantiacibacter aquimixticola]|uniref:Uncharacterized protein n=1 Tax=Alteraurantiacibacter aquimixticola TaxID=2489173 RepID=A0A4T3EZS4_9SPHN|nr:hypothetical protein [Alteraurantiacibacter aquimixticola]TIX49644.1 hypothetical protein E5222_12525 [Alteraurantiacibacter aquimixticola]